MRRMGGARHVVDEPRLAGSDLLEPFHVVDGLIRHGRLKVPARIADCRLVALHGRRREALICLLSEFERVVT